MDIKAAVTGRDRKTILDSCEYGEDVAVDAYDSAIKDMEEMGGSMSSPLHALIIRQRNLIKADHDQVRALRDMEAHHEARR